MEQALADLVGPDLRVLFCGINPGTLSGELGLHFARAGNRFWKLLRAGGFTESVLSPPTSTSCLSSASASRTSWRG
jgi:TDG/mug DNA glycosylase family protein